MTISERTIRSIERKLDRQLRPFSDSIYLELQDDGEMLLAVIRAKESLKPECYARMLETAQRVISPEIPPRKGAASWMAVIRTKDALVADAVNSEILT